MNTKYIEGSADELFRDLTVAKIKGFVLLLPAKTARQELAVQAVLDSINNLKKVYKSEGLYD